MGTREAILGGDGLIGSALGRRLREGGSEVTSFDLKSGWDLRRRTPFLAEYDRVWFLAWDTGGARYLEVAGHQHAIFKNNCEIAATVFDALSTSRRPFVFTTSQLAGREDAYGITKLMGEVWTRQLGGKVARLWNAYGWETPDDRSHVVTDLVRSGLEQQVVRTQTTGAERRRLLYKDDCAEALVTLFDGPGAEADIAGPEWVSIADLARRIAALLGVPAELGSATGQEVLVEPSRPLPGWRPRTSLEEGLRQIVAEARRFRTAPEPP
jgi:nucleoside-diphosphate-sugar epimerase